MLSLSLVERPDLQKYTIEQIASELPPPGWLTVFIKAKLELALASKILIQLEPYFPLKKDIFRAFDLCPLSLVKVVILGQDPYHSTDNGEPQANGMAFSTNRGHPIQPSLRNIYQELSREYPQDQPPIEIKVGKETRIIPAHKRFIPPSHGDLSKWAEQGVLLMNTCLTVAPHQAGSHMSKDKKGSFWNGFITRIIEAINETNPDCIFLLWGNTAQSFAGIGQRAIKLYASHPSPFSAHKASKDAPAFIGSNHFRQVNELLVRQGKPTIDWTLQ